MRLGHAIFLLFLAVQAATFAYAMLRGGAPERVSAIAQLAAWAVSYFLHAPGHPAFERVQWGVLAPDLGLLVVLILLAAVAERYWTLWLAALQMVAVMVHVARWLDPELARYVYVIVQTWWAYPMLALQTWGVYRHQQRLTVRGSDPSWSSSSPI